MARRREPVLLSDADLTLCLSRIPWQLLEAVKGRARLFVLERLKDPAATDVELVKRVRCSDKTPRLPEVKAALDASFAQATREALVTASEVIRETRTVLEGAKADRDWRSANGSIGILAKAVRLGEKDDTPADADAQARRLRAQLDEMDAVSAP